MDIDYATLYSDKPIRIYGIGSIKSPTYSEVCEITTSVYNAYLTIIMLKPETYVNLVEREHFLDDYSDEEKLSVKKFVEEYKKASMKDRENVTLYDILLLDGHIRFEIGQALNFFFEENVEFSYDGLKFNTYIENKNVEEPKEIKKLTLIERIKSFFIKKEEPEILEEDTRTIVGEFDISNFQEVIDVILERNGIAVEKKEEEEIPEFTNAATEKIYWRMKKQREEAEKAKAKQVDKNMDLGNIISSIVAFNHCGITPKVINEMTIFQIYDIFKRLRVNENYHIMCRSISVWGDEKGNFKEDLWYKNMDK